jgi:hypothetical protein
MMQTQYGRTQKPALAETLGPCVNCAARRHRRVHDMSQTARWKWRNTSHEAPHEVSRASAWEDTIFQFQGSWTCLEQ